MHEQKFENIINDQMPLTEKVAEQITQHIVSNKLSSGEKLPNEFELCSMLNVGRGTIREAVKILVARNILDIQRGRGTFISKNPGEIKDPFGFVFYKDKVQLVYDLLELRTEIEPWIASLAAERSTEEDIKSLEDNCQLVEDEILSGNNHLPADVDFHVSIANCTHNSVVPRLIPVIARAINAFGAVTNNSLRSETIIGHRDMLKAIKNHDVEAARKAMLEHMEINRRAIEVVLRKSQNENES